MYNNKPMQTPEGRKQNSPGLQPWEGYTPRNRPERASESNCAVDVSRQSGLMKSFGELQDNVTTTHTQSAALSGRLFPARAPRAKALGCSVYTLRVSRSAQTFICVSIPPSGYARVGAYAPSIDVYGSYFPAWLICLIAGVILTVVASQIGRVLDLSLLRKFGPLVPISLILIFSIATWFLFFAS
jgi:YtcA family